MSIAVDAARQQPQPDPESRWVNLCAQLIAEFPALRDQDVIAQVVSARGATDLFGLTLEDQFAAAMTIARNNLDILASGNDLARLDPETHARRKQDE